MEASVLLPERCWTALFLPRICRPCTCAESDLAAACRTRRARTRAGRFWLLGRGDSQVIPGTRYTHSQPAAGRNSPAARRTDCCNMDCVPDVWSRPYASGFRSVSFSKECVVRLAASPPQADHVRERLGQCAPRPHADAPPLRRLGRRDGPGRTGRS